MIRKYHNHKPQTTPRHREEEPLNHHETPGRQIKEILHNKARAKQRFWSQFELMPYFPISTVSVVVGLKVIRLSYIYDASVFFFEAGVMSFEDKKCVFCQLNSFKPYEISHSYHVEQFIPFSRVVWYCIHFYSN